MSECLWSRGICSVNRNQGGRHRHHHRVWKVLLNAGQVFCTSTHEILQHKTQTAPLPGATLELLLHVLGNQSDSSWNVWWASLKIKVQMGVYGGYEAFRESLCTCRGHAGRKTWKERFLLVLTSSLTLSRMNDQCPDHMSRERKEDKLLTRMTDGEKEDGDTSWLKPVTCSAAWELFTFLWHLMDSKPCT